MVMGSSVVNRTDDRDTNVDPEYGPTSRHPAADGEAEKIQEYYVDLKGRPVNRATTGGWKATVHIFALALADFENTILIGVTLLTYLVFWLNEPSAHAATVLSNNFGTLYLLSILGGFLADSYLGSFWTIAVGTIISGLGYGLLVLCVTYDKLRPPRCVSTPTVFCPPPGAQYTAPLYVALYMVALGSGLIKPNVSSLGADQFDDSNPKEREQSTHYFTYNFFSIHFGFLLAIFLGVYLLYHVSPGWCYGSGLILFVCCAIFFFLGAWKFRHRPPTGSFLTRVVQVGVAALRKRNVGIVPDESAELYETSYPTRGMLQKLPHTPKLRILDRAAVISGPEDKEAAIHNTKPWSLCTVTQVEETKRILQIIPVFIPVMFVGIVTSQIPTFTVLMAQTLDRNLGPHFTIPPASVAGIVTITSLIFVPFYDLILVPLVRKFNKNPYGFTPLQLLGAALFFAVMTSISAALVERRRLSTVRDLHLQNLIIGTYILPLSFWYMLPIYVFYGLNEFCLYVSLFSFFYKEATFETRSIGSTFTWSALSLGFFFGSILINSVNRATRHQKGGSWLVGQLTDGGIEKFYWLISVIMSVVFLVYLVAAYCYTYKYDWYHEKDYEFGGSPQTTSSTTQISESSEKKLEDQ